MVNLCEIKFEKVEPPPLMPREVVMVCLNECCQNNWVTVAIERLPEVCPMCGGNEIIEEI